MTTITQNQTSLARIVGLGKIPTDAVLTVTAAHMQGGWSHQDHLIDSRGIESMVGARYESMAQVERDATRLADTRSYPTVVVQISLYGRTLGVARYDGSPSMIGRAHPTWTLVDDAPRQLCAIPRDTPTSRL